MKEDSKMETQTLNPTAEKARSPRVLVNAYHNSGHNKGRLIAGEEYDLSELENIILEGVSYGYYMQIIPSSALVDERKNNGDILLMFSAHSLRQR